MMLSINLIPAQRLQQHKVAARIARWAVVGALYLVGLTVVAALCWLTPVRQSVDAEDLAAVDAEIGVARTEIEVAQLRLAEAQAELGAARTVADQPDWAMLMAMVARSLGDDVVLESVALAPLDSAGSAQPRHDEDGRSDHYRLEMSGYGRSQASVSKFVLGLESLGVFTKVTINSTRRVTLGDGQAVSFSLECRLDARPMPEGAR